MKISLEQRVMAANDEIAAALRRQWDERAVAVVNLVSSPGSGKTALLERTLEQLRGLCAVAVLVGDIQTENDARRLSGYGFRVKQILTSGACHLEASMIAKHFPRVDTQDLQLLLIENVGNLVCPSAYDLGEDAKVVLVSVTEGEDKPLKYPGIFRRAQAAVVTKIDLLPYLDFNLEELRRNIAEIHADLPVFLVSSRTGDGISAWVDWLLGRPAVKVQQR